MAVPAAKIFRVRLLGPHEDSASSKAAHRSSMNPDDRSRGALKILQKLGVEDASKVSKPSVNYCLHDVRTGKQCGNCSMWLDRMSGKDLSCSLVEGLVRCMSSEHFGHSV